MNDARLNSHLQLAMTQTFSIHPQITAPTLTSGGRTRGARARSELHLRLTRRVKPRPGRWRALCRLSRQAKTSGTKRTRVNRRSINLPLSALWWDCFVRKCRAIATKLLKCEKSLISVSLHKQADAKFDQTLQAESGSLASLSTVSTSRAIHAWSICDFFGELKVTDKCSVRRWTPSTTIRFEKNTYFIEATAHQKKKKINPNKVKGGDSCPPS